MTGRGVSVGLAYMYEPVFNRAVLPLMESGAVDALEWSFDTVADAALLPDWQRELLRTYAAAGRLYGHGVYYSLLNAGDGLRQEAWLHRFETVQEQFPFRHVSEHFGFMSSRDAHRGCPLPLPMTSGALELGRRRLAALAAVAACPVGIENLALSFSGDEVLRHGSFLEQLVGPAGGFIVLDLHNLYCQSHNFGIGMRELLESYPLERVREIHVSGGSWAPDETESRQIRRDTHDDRIPDEVLDHLGFAVSECPNLDLVVVERLGDTLTEPFAEAAFRDEFLGVKSIVNGAAAERIVPQWPFVPALINGAYPADIALSEQQQFILSTLATATSPAEVKSILVQSGRFNDWNIESWKPGMIHTAMQLGKKWGIEADPF